MTETSTSPKFKFSYLPEITDGSIWTSVNVTCNGMFLASIWHDGMPGTNGTLVAYGAATPCVNVIAHVDGEHVNIWVAGPKVMTVLSQLARMSIAPF